MVSSFALAGGVVFFALFCQMGTASAQQQPDFGSPVGCELGRDCFVQQYVDLEPAPDAVDPFCGRATYDGHDGTDIRVLSMPDMANGVPVLAVADGIVLRTRNEEPDRLVRTPEVRDAVAGRECGNGVVIEHAGGIETQYCHLRRGSVPVAPGDAVKKAQPIGEVGASGLAEFPHVHLSVRRDGKNIDPVTGRAQGQACDASASLDASLFEAAVAPRLVATGPQRLASGLADRPVTEEMLVTNGSPSIPEPSATATVGWTWLVNLRKGDRLTVRLIAPDGLVFAENEIPPLDRDKATYVAYAGRKRAPAPGDYRVETIVRRGDATILSGTSVTRVE